MYEKVNPSHPDKVADRISGALVDYCYSQQRDPRCAIEVQLGHGLVTIIAESSVTIPYDVAVATVERIAGRQEQIILRCVPQDPHLADNQQHGFRCGDNGIFRGCPVTQEQRLLTALARTIYQNFPTDGKYIIGDYGRNPLHENYDGANDQIRPTSKNRSKAVVICQSNASYDEILALWFEFFIKNEGERVGPHVAKLGRNYYSPLINPLGPWTGGPMTDTGCCNRKLGSDLGDAVTGGGIHGKDLTKSDVSATIVCHIKAQASGEVVEATCAIGDESITFRYASGKTETHPFSEVVEMARLYLLTDCDGSFEKLAEWGLIR